MDPVLAHFVADWCLQSQWMASSKTSRWLPAAVHVAVYGALFALLVPAARSWPVLAVVVGTHYLIDRYRLARHVNWAANFIAPVQRLTHWERRNLCRPPSERSPEPRVTLVDPIDHPRRRSTNPPWSECSTYGSPPGTPDHIGFIVMVTIDQIMHLVVNWATLRWLG